VQRIVAHEARILHLAWTPERKAYEFRLMYGRRFLTPVLWLTPLHWYDLVDGRSADIDGWVGLIRRGKLLEIRPLKVLDYGSGMSGVPKEWPHVYFPDFYDAATAERGERPEANWTDIYEEALDAKRSEWGPA
jgi:hypothetical protein